MGSKKLEVGKNSSGTRADKLRLSKLSRGGNGAFVGMGLDTETGKLNYWMIHNSHSFTTLHEIAGVTDFDLIEYPADFKITILLFVKRASPLIHYKVIKFDSSKNGIVIGEERSFGLSQLHDYQLSNINCKAEDNRDVRCALNSEGIYLTAVNIMASFFEDGKQHVLQNEMYEKVRSKDGAEMYLDKHYLTHRVIDYSKDHKQCAYFNIYKRYTAYSPLKTPKLHAQVKIDCSEDTNEQLIQQYRSGQSLMRIESILNPELRITMGSLGQRAEQETSQPTLTLNMRSQNPEFITSLVQVIPAMQMQYLGSDVTDFSKYTMVLNGKPYPINLELMLLNQKVPDPDPESSSSSEDPDPDPESSSSSEDPDPDPTSSSAAPSPSEISSSSTSSSQNTSEDNPFLGNILGIIVVLLVAFVIFVIGWLTYRHLRLKSEKTQ